MSGENYAETGWSRPRRRRRHTRAHVNYEEMSVRYGSVKLQLPSGFKSLLEHLTREILREQPANIPEFATAYFKHLLQKRKDGLYDSSYIVNERKVEAVKESEPAVDEPQPSYEEPVAQSSYQVDDVTSPSTKQPVEEMPDLNDPDVQKAATKIQASFRGFHVRRSLPTPQAPMHREMAYLRNEAGQSSTSSFAAEDATTSVINDAVLTIESVTVGDERRDSSSSLYVAVSETSPDVLESLETTNQRRHSDLGQSALQVTTTHAPTSSPVLARTRQGSVDDFAPAAIPDVPQQNDADSNESDKMDDTVDILLPTDGGEFGLRAESWAVVEQTTSVEMASIAAEMGSLPDDSLPEVDVASEDKKNDPDVAEGNQSEAATIPSENTEKAPSEEAGIDKENPSPLDKESTVEILSPAINAEQETIDSKQKVEAVSENAQAGIEIERSQTWQHQQDEDAVDGSPAQDDAAPAESQQQEEEGSADTTAEAQETVAEVQETAAEVQETVAEVQETAAEVQETAVEVQETAAEVQETAAEVQETAAEVQETATETQEREENSAEPEAMQEPVEVPAQESATAEEASEPTVEENPAAEETAENPTEVGETPAAEETATEQTAENTQEPIESAAQEEPSTEAETDAPAQVEEPPKSEEVVTESAEASKEDQQTTEAAVEPTADSAEKTDEAPAESQEEPAVSMAEHES